MKTEIRRFKDFEELSRKTAEYICDTACRCVDQSGRFTFVLSGGRTPQRLYELLSMPPFSDRMPWDRIHLYWGDERCVPFDHPDSNYGTARRLLIGKVPVPEENVHRIPVDEGSPEEAAGRYEKDLTDFDLVLLGIGKDGHTASLFPGHPVLEEENHLTAPVFASAGTPPGWRVTLTLPAICSAGTVLFLVSGEQKKKIVDLILADPGKAEKLYPAARVRAREKLIWAVVFETADERR